jgi:hypothetical protein
MRDNPPVCSRGRLRQFVATVAALSLAGMAALPAEHVHGGQSDHDADHGRLIHRHYDAHHPVGPAITIEGHDDDHDVQWIASFVTRSESSVNAQPRAIVAAVLPAVSQRTFIRLFFPSAESLHDPPSAPPPALRGPPPPRLT